MEAGQSDLRLSTLQRYAAAIGSEVGFAVSPGPVDRAQDGGIDDEEVLP